MNENKPFGIYLKYLLSLVPYFETAAFIIRKQYFFLGTVSKVIKVMYQYSNFAILQFTM